MKRFFVFALTLLLATVSLFLTESSALESDYRFDTKFDGAVYGEVNAWTWFKYPYAHSKHAAYVWNDGPGAVKFYVTSTMKVFWNGGSYTPPPRVESDILGDNSSRNVYERFSFNMKGKPAGIGRIVATTTLEVRDISTNVKLLWPVASVITRFKL